MPPASGFSFTRRKNGEVVILHHGAPATVLRGRAADRFVEALQRSDEQELMARVTGNHRRGNERRAASHPRNAGRRTS